MAAQATGTSADAGESAPADSTSRPEGEERRERRSRDRYGRDRRERNGERGGDRSDVRADAPSETVPLAADDAVEAREPVARSYFDRPSSAPTPAMESPAAIVPSRSSAEGSQMAPEVIAAPAVPAIAIKAGAGARLPEVVSFRLPLAELTQVAEQSGLQWVNSDAAKIAAVQAAIAAEPPRVHIPRERPPVVVTDEGPLVLVETQKDLRNLGLPF
jgi:ribonuclease E